MSAKGPAANTFGTTLPLFEQATGYCTESMSLPLTPNRQAPNRQALTRQNINGQTSNVQHADRHLRAARKLSRKIRATADRSPEQTRAGQLICRHLIAMLQAENPSSK